MLFFLNLRVLFMILIIFVITSYFVLWDQRLLLTILFNITLIQQRYFYEFKLFFLVIRDILNLIMNEFIIKNILWLGVNIQSTQYSSSSTRLINPFKAFDASNAWLLEQVHPYLRVVCLYSSFTWAISPTTLLSRFSFFLHTSIRNTFSSNWFRSCLSTSYWEFGLTPLKNSIIVKYSKSDPPLFSYRSPINNCLRL